MNEIIESLYRRKSVRVFEDRSVPAEMKAAILRSAAEAPTAGCQQLYTILDITDQALKDALAETCDHQSFIARAPMVLVFCADCKKWYDAYHEAGCDPRAPGVGDLMLAFSDAAIAAQNAVVAAESQMCIRDRFGGIGSIPGAVIGAFIIGICESFIKSNENIAVFSNAVTFALLIIILLCKPNGLFGEKLTEKV